MYEYQSVKDAFQQEDECAERRVNYINQARREVMSNSYNSLEFVKGYGSQTRHINPFYRTSNEEYGWYPPGIHTSPSVYYPMQQRFTSQLAAAGMYRNHSLNTAMDPQPYQ